MASEQEVEAVRGDGSGAARESRTQQRRWVTQFTLGHLCTRNPEAMRMLGVGVRGWNSQTSGRAWVHEKDEADEAEGASQKWRRLC